MKKSTRFWVLVSILGSSSSRHPPPPVWMMVAAAVVGRPSAAATRKMNRNFTAPTATWMPPSADLIPPPSAAATTTTTTTTTTARTMLQSSSNTMLTDSNATATATMNLHQDEVPKGYGTSSSSERNDSNNNNNRAHDRTSIVSAIGSLIAFACFMLAVGYFVTRGSSGRSRNNNNATNTTRVAAASSSSQHHRSHHRRTITPYGRDDRQSMSGSIELPSRDPAIVSRSSGNRNNSNSSRRTTLPYEQQQQQQQPYLLTQAQVRQLIEGNRVDVEGAEDDGENTARNSGSGRESRRHPCPICIEECNPGSDDDNSSNNNVHRSVVSLPWCRHNFHVDCIVPWLTEQKAVCPMCNDDIRRRMRGGGGA
jgi:RING-H2 zinc finger domain